MKKFFIQLGKTVMIIVLSIAALMGIYNFLYYQELRTIKANLNSIEGVKVINIGGNDDVTLEEICARIRINDSVQMVLGELSKDAYNYPNDVYIYEINGISMNGQRINIGIGSSFYRKYKIVFNSPEDVIRNYKIITKELLKDY